ncbi:YihY/virulence factor BrkB family protein [Rubrivirga sp. S365]|uniref:YihY/virulence factor BrkB family protein n=1 Tax=Rubrivirga litoralis TaxID=3075598 RepID=A0ABU3BR79_9BACT|nr:MULTISPECIES: YihY/virulence factor BrkB family protein [unclassified Rubrivirga]MDT0631779.1 YihY/virulence factor BrkB family protein [Rubrivirga sp. F394]MDT7856529.1 YihY/virulence factor BrkB family protein [Rubrivirga sp. S365]
MLRTASHHARRALGPSKYYGSGLLKVLMTDPIFLWAQAISFKTLVTLLPLLLLAAGVFGLILRGQDSFTTVASFLRTFLPPGQSDELVALVFELQKASGQLTIVGAAVFLFTVVTLFATLRYVVGAAMGERRHQMRSLFGGYAFDLRMMVQVGVLFLLSLAITAVATVIQSRSGAVAGEVGLDPALAEAAGGVVARVLLFVVPYVLTVGMLVQLYYYVPRPHPPWRSALWGAAVGAVVFEAAKRGFTFYATYLADFDRYAAQGPEAGALGGLGGVFGLVLAFVFWVYFSGLILVVGASVAALHERRHRPRRSRIRRLWTQMGATRRRRARASGGLLRRAGREAAGDGRAPDALGRSDPAPVVRPPS